MRCVRLRGGGKNKPARYYAPTVSRRLINPVLLATGTTSRAAVENGQRSGNSGGAERAAAAAEFRLGGLGGPPAGARAAGARSSDRIDPCAGISCISNAPAGRLGTRRFAFAAATVAQRPSF